MSDVPVLALNDGHAIPQVGVGVFKVPAEDTASVVADALEVGYRLVDTAWGYMNEQGVGEGIRRSGLGRDEVFVTTKVWNTYQGAERTRESFGISLANLGFDVVDLLLVHWPAPVNDLYVETWETFVELRESGRVRSIGVSNFEPEHLQRVIDATGVVPAVNQIELHPYLQQRELRAFHAEHGIVTEAWGPIARGVVLDDPTVAEVAEAQGRTPAQVVLRWELQHGIVVIPKSARHERLVENLALFDFELSVDEMAAIDALDRDHRTGPHPATFA